MNISFEAAALHLKPGGTIHMREPAGSMLQVLDGTVWVTEEGNPRDVVLRRGQCFRLAGRGLALVEAFGDASISLVPA